MATRELPPNAQLRARRWDVAIVGSGIAALVAAARLGAAGVRTLVLEEGSRRDAFPGLREPFSLGGPGGLLDATLRELQLPLIDRRRLVPREVAHQVIGDDLRLDVGPPGLTAGEWVAWGVAKPDAARRAIGALTATESDSTARADRELAAAIGEAPALGDVLDEQALALSNAAPGSPLDAAARRTLLQGPLRGGFGFEDAPPWLSGILRRRAEGVGVDFRSVRGPFELLQSDGQAAIWVESSGELWLSRTLVIAAADAALLEALPEEARPGALDPKRRAVRRHAFVYQVPLASLPEPMGASLVLAGERPDEAPVTVSVYRGVEDSRGALLVARQVLPEGETRSEGEARIQARLGALMPNAGDRITARSIEVPVWDDDDWLVEAQPGDEPLVRLSSSPPTLRLERGAFALRGLDGDLTLGWLAADALARSAR